jgi:lipopolysaccharide export system permease protein
MKYFFIVLFSLETFFVGLDLLQKVSKLPDSANLQLLYVMYNSFFVLTITLPLSILFAWVLTLTMLIKDNNLISFYSLGVSKSQVIKPIIYISIFLTSILIFLQTTPLAYSFEQKDKIIDNKYFVSEKSNIFLKYNNNFIYFEKLFPIEKKALNIRIFRVKNKQLVQTIIAKKAFYQNDRWYVIDAKVISKPEEVYWDKSKLVVTYEKFLYTLEGFKPNIINNVYQTKVDYSILDAIYTIALFDKQNLNTNKIRAILYSKLFIPFFVVPLLIILFLYSDTSARFFKMGKFISVSVFSVLGVWGIMFLIQRLSVANLLNAELVILFPLFLLYLFAYISYRKKILYA